MRSNLIASQIERHRPFGGVVPEIASREHLQHLMPLVRQAVGDAGIGLTDLSALAVTSGPGLIGALLVGVAAAQGLAYGLDLPLVPVNHLEGHIYSPYLRPVGEAYPLPERFLCLVVSGGHSSVYDVRRDGTVAMLNRTRDDAAGEIFDKVAKFVGLPYPGGPQIEKTAAGGDHARFVLPVARFRESTTDFSFSGLKSSAIRLARAEGLEGAGAATEGASREKLRDFCASFQKAVGDQILDRLGTLWSSVAAGGEAVPSELGLAGGVAANGPLRERVMRWCADRRIVCRLADRRYTTDNAAMIAFAGLRRIGRVGTDPSRVVVRSRMQVE